MDVFDHLEEAKTLAEKATREITYAQGGLQQTPPDSATALRWTNASQTSLRRAYGETTKAKEVLQSSAKSHVISSGPSVYPPIDS